MSAHAAIWIIVDDNTRELNGASADLAAAKGMAEKLFATESRTVYDNVQNLTCDCQWHKVGKTWVLSGINEWDYEGKHHRTHFPYFVLVRLRLDADDFVPLSIIGQVIAKIRDEIREKEKNQ